mmetsp:Transcript_23731/g.49445  ORF Transcript_23731/g.49445 Transcript_23731/m.49445 type:complete len:422 (+) Transcript_23731:34-1299(+)
MASTLSTTKTPIIRIPSDGGAIVVKNISMVSPDHAKFSLGLRPEKCLEGEGIFKQWFYFEVQNAPIGAQLEFSIEDAGVSTFNDWNGYKTCMLLDRDEWIRVKETEFKDGVLSWKVTASSNLISFSYFPPYSLERQVNLVHSTAAAGICSHVVLGQSEEGRDLHALVFDKHLDASLPHYHVVWIQHRQHPGETSASWFCEGVLSRLTEMSSSPSALLKNCVIIVVPNVNPDGGVRGHLRTNAKGANLNRCWGGTFHGLENVAGQTNPKAVEVEAMVRGMKAMDGVDLMMDVHQDEEKPYVFISKSPLGCPSCTPEIKAMREKFESILQSRSPDFLTPGPVEPVGYPVPDPGKANLSICSASVAEAFPGCLSMTMEHPYKGNVNRGGEFVEGFTIDQCRGLGKDTVDAIEEILPHLIRKHVR